ncbi:ATP-binding protein [Pseudodesulfovibrio sp. zrk46]|uniref:ATP-binding protein n=1 Tax=Pseudodesulfovibrio sp. zrk46 TaxID=2725288 RepID=UPI001449295B|nr:ATP-binding protein [Pseudodesulfovibrio sp. zrk46]QJB56037.1 PAS domain S-box protein [Pseudodesulfovibrio sp. zrk46]
MFFWRSVGIRSKLIIIFILIKVLPLIALAVIAWNGITMLGANLKSTIESLSAETQIVIDDVKDLAVESSIRALDIKSRENIERLTTDTARAVAAFLYQRDNDVRMAASLAPNDNSYAQFMAPKRRVVTEHRPWKLNAEGTAWQPAEPTNSKQPTVTADNPDNAKDFHYRPPEDKGIPVERPLYHEMTFIDLQGNERVKVSATELLPPEKRNIADPANTFCKAENYFDALKKLKPGEIYVSEVIGPYLRSPIIGAYTKETAKIKGIEFHPEQAAYAGKENPVGKRFQGIIRWATPVVRDDKVIGWVTLALDHTHVMEFSDHIVPTDERYSPISDAGSGNYAFIWDYKDRNISHPRDYFITGYDPETGLPAVPWLEETLYEEFRQSGLPISTWEADAPVMQAQSLKKKPSKALTTQGMLGLDCRYLNFAPQCQGWYNLTKDGGSGSFVIFWSGLWKLTTAAAIPYFTGRYGDTPRGFGFVTIGANVHEFHKAATETEVQLSEMATSYGQQMAQKDEEAQQSLKGALRKTGKEISWSTIVMIVLVILVAIWMASALTKKITGMIKGIRRFQNGDMEHRLEVGSADEIGQLARTFNEMSDDIEGLISEMRQAEENYRGFFENSTEGIFRTSAEGKLINVNPAFAKQFGFSSTVEMLREVGEVAADLYAEPERRKELLRQLEKNGRVRDFEFAIKRRDGEIRTLQTSCYWVNDKEGNRYIEGMSSDVTERKLALETLEQAKNRAEQLSQMKSNFLSTVSHELRTPLTSIIGFAKLIRKNLSHLLADNAFDDKTTKKLVRAESNTHVIITEGDRLTELINNVLDLAKLESGYSDWKTTTISIEDILEQSIAATRVLFDAKGLRLEKDIAPDLPPIQGDHDRIVQVCINLLANATKFTDTGIVSCQASLQNDEILIRVSDTGIGVSGQEAIEIFDKFRQLGDTLTDKPRGTGLGLPICKEIVEYHGGRIWHEPNPDGGSIFSFTLKTNWSFSSVAVPPQGTPQ